MKSFYVLAANAAVTSAHTIFLQLAAGGTTNPIGYAIRTPSYDGPIQDVTTQYIACNGGPNPTTPSSGIINVNAGDTVQAVWRHTLQSGPDDVVDASHKGPVMAYMKKVTDSTTDVGYGSGWFKISEAGLNVATQTWAVTDLIANQGLQSITIPKCIANGQYLLRAELIALHAAGSSGGAQFYMECAQINVSGGTGATTPSTVSLPGAYSASDPGILINIYQTLTSYTIPGPRPLTCGASQSTTSAGVSSTTTATTSAAVTTTTTRAATTTTTTRAVTTSSTTRASTTTSSSSSSGGSPLYGQCGGSTWTGPTTCAAGTCTYSNAFYSQCLP